MGLLTRETLLKKRPKKTRTLTVPERFGDFAGQEIILQSLTAAEKTEFEMRHQGSQRKVGLKTIRQRMLVATMVDNDGNHLLTEEDVKSLSDVDGAFADWVIDHAQDLCGWSKKDVEDLAGN